MVVGGWRLVILGYGLGFQLAFSLGFILGYCLGFALGFFWPSTKQSVGFLFVDQSDGLLKLIINPWVMVPVMFQNPITIQNFTHRFMLFCGKSADQPHNLVAIGWDWPLGRVRIIKKQTVRAMLAKRQSRRVAQIVADVKTVVIHGPFIHSFESRPLDCAAAARALSHKSVVRRSSQSAHAG